MNSEQSLSPTSPVSFRCDRCGNALSTAEAICASCDAELDSATDSSTRPGKHICPVCEKSFASPILAHEPAEAKWYVPQTQGFQCPHCRGRLLDSRDPILPGYQVAALIALAIGFQFLLPAPYVRTGLIGLVIVYLAIYLRRRSWGVPDSKRYVADEG